MNLSLGVDQHVADHAQALDLWIERAQAIGQFFGQHRNHAARKIDAGGAVVGVNVNRTAGFHVMADICNSDQQTPTLAAPHFGRLAIDRIIKVARVFTVNGDQRNIGQVNTAQLVSRADRIGQGTGQRQCAVAELMRNAVFSDGDFNFHAGIVKLAQNFRDTPHRLAKQCRRLGQLNHHDLASFSSARASFGNQHILTVTLVFRRDEPHTAFLQQPPNDGIGRTLDDFSHATFWPVLAVMAHDARFDAIFVQYRSHFVGWQVNICLAVIALNKTVTITMAGYGSLEFSQKIGRSP